MTQRSSKHPVKSSKHPVEELFIHFGFHKTGSSTIQVFLTRLFEWKLTHRESFLYPQTGRTSSGWPYNHTDLLPLVRRDPQWMQQCLREEATRSNAKKVVISSEEFCKTHELSSVKAITDAYPGARVTLIGVVRDHDTWLESMYAEDVKRNRTFEEPWEYISRRLPQFSFLKTFERFRDIFPDAEIKAVKYDYNKIVQVFTKILFGRELDPETVSRENASLEPAVVFMLQDLYKAVPYDEDLAKVYIDGAYKLQAIIGWPKSKIGYLSSLERQHIYAHYYDEIMRLSVDYFGLSSPFWSPERSVEKYAGCRADDTRRMILKLLAEGIKNPYADE